MVKELCGRGLLDDAASVQKKHTVRDGTGKLHLVGDDDHRFALAGQVKHDIQHLTDHLRVKGGGHFVEEQNFGVHTQRPHDGNALLLAAGKLPRVAFGLLQQAHAVQQGFGLLLHLSFGALLHFGGSQKDVVQHGQVWKKLVALEHHPDALAQGRQILAAVGDGLAAQLHPACLHRLQSVQTAQQGALAAAGRPHHDDDLAGLNAKAYVIQDVRLTIVAFHQMVHGQDRF